MRLIAPNPGLPFLAVTPLSPITTPSPKVGVVPVHEQPVDIHDGLVSIRYTGASDQSRAVQVTARDSFARPYDIRQVRGSLDDAIRAARELATVEGYEENVALGVYARSSVAILGAAQQGRWLLVPLAYYDAPGDEMPAIVSMPIDRVSADASAVRLPYGTQFDAPAAISVRFDDPRVAAVVGVDSIALPPTH